MKNGGGDKSSPAKQITTLMTNPQLMKMRSLKMTIIDFCRIPRTMRECLDEGFTTHQVYNAVRKNQLSNVNRKDAWGRTKRGPGLFVVRDESMRLDQLIVSTKDLATALTAWR
jgi:hypothetical protein